MDCFEQQAPCYSSEPVYSPRTKTDSTERPGRTPILFHKMVLYKIDNFLPFIRRLASSLPTSMFVVINQVFLLLTHTTNDSENTRQTVFVESPTKKIYFY